MDSSPPPAVTAPPLAPILGPPGFQAAADRFLAEVQEIRARTPPPRVGAGAPPAPVGAQLTLTEVLGQLVGGLVPGLALADAVGVLDGLPGASGESGVPAYFGAAARFLMETVKGIVASILGDEQAAVIDTSGDLVKFVATFSDAISFENVLTSGPLSFADALQLENQLEGMHVLFILGSYLFHLIVSAVSLGVVGSTIGLLINLIDRMIGDKSRILSTQLVRRAVGDPFESGYQRIHRHKDLSTSEAEESYALGLLPETEYVDVLVGNGFTNRAIQRKVELGRVRALNQAGVFPLRTKFIPPSTLIQAYAARIVDDDGLLGELARQGYDDNALEIFHTLAQLKKPPPAPPVG